MDKDTLLAWLNTEFKKAKEAKEKFKSSPYNQRYYDGVMSAYQQLQFAIDTGELK